jgi:hypothetical protein
MRRDESFEYRVSVFEQDAKYFPRFERINQIELSDEYAYVTVIINEPPLGR